MGQKVHPGGLRVGIIHDWKSNWYTEKEFARVPASRTSAIRDHIYGKLAHAGLSDIHIRKDSQKITIDIYTARPGIVIGKSGSEVDALRKRDLRDDRQAVQININEIKRPELDAKLMAQSVAEQLQNRVSFRRAMKRSLASAVRSGAQGVQGQVRRPPRRHRDVALGAVLGGPRAAAHAARRHRLRLRRGEDDLRPHRRQGVDQQGRDHARGLRGRRRRRRRARRGRRPAAPRRRRGAIGGARPDAAAAPRRGRGRRRWPRRWPRRRSWPRRPGGPGGGRGPGAPGRGSSQGGRRPPGPAAAAPAAPAAPTSRRRSSDAAGRRAERRHARRRRRGG